MYIKTHQIQLLNNSVSVIKHGLKKYSSSLAVINDKSKGAIYPPISDESADGRRKRRKEEWHTKIRKIQTVEEKLFELNMPRYYGWRMAYIPEHKIPYNTLNFAQYVTRSCLVRDNKLPQCYGLVPPNTVDSIVQIIKPQIEETIILEHCSQQRRGNSNISNNTNNNIQNTLIYKINRILLSNLSSTAPHLLEVEVDFEPRIEASWFVGGMSPSKHAVNNRYAEDMPFQYVGNPILTLRHRLPLPEVDDFTNVKKDVIRCVHDPRTIGYCLQRRHATNIPGFWPGDPSEFGLLSYHNTSMCNRPSTYDDKIDAYAVQAIYASYSWLLAQACYQGFTTFNELTYPLLTQAILTNGQKWLFSVYQLNTVLLHSEHIDENLKTNVCWMTEPMRLYHRVENEKIHEFNDDVLKYLVRFYLNVPREREGIIMKPYLGEFTKVIADIPGNHRREWMERQYKHLVSNRPRHRPPPEISHWEWIFKIRCKRNLLMAQKRQPWEYGINVLKRRLDDHAPRYIPKCLRVNPKKKKINRFEATHYPNPK